MEIWIMQGMKQKQKNASPSLHRTVKSKKQKLIT